MCLLTFYHLVIFYSLFLFEILVC